MTTSFRSLPSRPLPVGTPVYRYVPTVAGKVKLTDPATSVMTDLRRVNVVTVDSNQLIDLALERMKHAGVRMLLVTGEDDTVAGVITSRDISGEKPVEYASRERVPREKIKVADIMTPREHTEVLSMDDVLKADVGDIVVTLRDAGRQHAIVIEQEGSGSQAVLRGVFSVTQIGRQLGVEIEPTGRTQSFAELESVLGASTAGKAT